MFLIRFLLCFKKRFCCSTLIYQKFNWKQIQAIWYVSWCYNSFHPYQGLDQSNFYSFNQRKVFCFSIYLIPTYKKGSTRKKNNAITDSQYSTCALRNNFHLWHFLLSGYLQASKTSGFFFLLLIIFLVSSPRLL